jgi:anti-sigma factor ChrR (cupin superfamily)
MALPQDISPLNSELMDGMIFSSKMEWVQTEPGAASKILWTSAETGRWAVLLKWDKGYVAGQHKHLSAAYAYIIKGKLQVRDGVMSAGDFLYEPNGMIHGETTALEDTEYLFMCDGPVLGFDDNGFTGYTGWEELERQRLQQVAAASAG